MRIVALIMMSLPIALPAKAAAFKVVRSDQQALIVSMAGEIKIGDPAKLQRILGSNQFAPTRVLFLNSEGGLVQPALELGLAVRAYGVTTVIAHKAECLSACSMVFVAGRTVNGVSPSRVKFSGGKLGVHRPFNQETGRLDPRVRGQLRSYLDFMDAGSAFYRLTLTTSPRTMRLIKNAELKAMGNYRIMGLTKFQKPQKQPKVYARKKSQRNIERWRRSLLESND